MLVVTTLVLLQLAGEPDAAQMSSAAVWADADVGRAKAATTAAVRIRDEERMVVLLLRGKGRTVDSVGIDLGRDCGWSGTAPTGRSPCRPRGGCTCPARRWRTTT